VVHVVVTFSIITVLRFYKGVVHVVVVMLFTIAVYGLIEEWFMLFWLVIVSTITV
jgi:hypothetical protein